MKIPSAVRCMLIRGGTSKGAYFLASDLPSSREERDALLLSIMGSPHPDQIDGIGGGHPLRSKVAIVAKSSDPGIDIDFLFAQVAVDKPLVDTSPNCGNILAGIGPFIIERGLVKPQEGSTSVRVKTLNTGTVEWIRLRHPTSQLPAHGTASSDKLRIDAKGFEEKRNRGWTQILHITGTERDLESLSAYTCVNLRLDFFSLDSRSFVSIRGKKVRSPLNEIT